MTHSPLPWNVSRYSPSAVFDANGDKIAATKEGHAFRPIDEEIAEANAALIAGMSQEIERLRAQVKEAVVIMDAVEDAVLRAMQDKADPEIYGAIHAMKLNKARARAAALTILNLPSMDSEASK